MNKPDLNIASDEASITLHRRGPPLWVLFLAIGSLITAGGLFYVWQRAAIYPSTDDAYVGAHIIDVAPEVTGRVTDVFVANNQAVEAGQVLFRLDTRPFDYALAEAEAGLDMAIEGQGASSAGVAAASALLKEREAGVAIARAEAARARTLFKRGDIARSRLDEMETNLKSAGASLEAAQAELERANAMMGSAGADNAAVRAALSSVRIAQYNREQAEVRAPAAGLIADLALRPGALVQPGRVLFHLVETGDWWIDANFKETDLKRIRPGQCADIHVDMFPDVDFSGAIETISPASGATVSLFPPENATGNWVKVTQRFTVRVRIDSETIPADRPLRVGASARVVVDTSAGGCAVPAADAEG